MKKLEFQEEVFVADTSVEEIKVKPLSFVELVDLWGRVDPLAKSPEASLRRLRIAHQVHFMSKGDRLAISAPDIGQLPRVVAQGILGLLDEDTGERGKLIRPGNGITTPLGYKLGTPIKMSSKGKEGKTEITELEFMAKTYGEVEDVLAAGNELAQTLELLRSVATPVSDTSLTRLPGWALDNITVADGVTIMKDILPHF